MAIRQHLRALSAAAAATVLVVVGVAVTPGAASAASATKVSGACSAYHYLNSKHSLRTHVCSNVYVDSNLRVYASMWTDTFYQSYPDGNWHISTTSTVNVSGTLHVTNSGSTSANKTEHDGYVDYTTKKIQCHVGDVAQVDVTSYYGYVDTPDWTCRV
jgi:hypothetical protein